MIYQIAIIIISILSGVAAGYWLTMPWYEAGCIAIFCFLFLNFVTQLGRRILILELIMLLATVQWLLSTVIAYEFFNKYHKQASIWATFMTIPSETYFAFALPGTIMLIIGLTFPINWFPLPSHRTLVTRAQEYLKQRSHIGVVMSLIGMSIFFWVPYTPTIIRGALSFFSFLLYVGLFYVLFSPKTRYKNFVLLIVLSVMLANAAMTGMYGEIVFWGILYLIMYFMQYPASLIKKVTMFVLGAFIILLIQSIKADYRDATWGKNYARGSDFILFGELIWDRLNNTSKLINPEALFAISVRSNQGFIIAQSLNYVPKRTPFANGETIATSVAAAFIPRLLWPDKPQTGGKANVQRFLGSKDVEYSFNLSPLGEGYVNFGKIGGIIFMFFYGLLFNWAFRYCLYLGNKYPSIIAWIPLLFVGSIGVETDLLTTLGSLIKAAMFTWFMFWFCRVFFNVNL